MEEVKGKGSLSNSELASQVISKYTGTTQQTNKRKSEPVNQSDEEYTRKRARNNIAVKKSREKAKHRILETQSRVEQLSQENEELQTKVTLLSKELNVLRALFTNGGFTLPCELQYLGNGNDPDHNSSESLHTSHHSVSSHHVAENLSPYTSHLVSSTLPTKTSSLSKIEDSKIPPLRPMPRVVNGHNADKSPSETTYPVSGKTFSSVSERDNQFSYTHKPSVYYKDFLKASTVITSSQISSSTPSQPNISPHSHSEYQLLQSYKIAPVTQHTSVIRDATKLSETKVNSQNTLGKFCIIQDPENNGQVKIVPMNV